MREISSMANNRVQFGIAPINWSNDDMHELGGSYTLQTILSEMSQAGYSGTEIGNKFPKEAVLIKEALKKFDLELASSWHSTFFLSNDLDIELENIKKKVLLLHDAGAKVINIAECSGSVHSELNSPLSNKLVCNDQDWDRLTSSLNKAGELCNSFDLDLAYHHHMGTYVQTEDEINRLLSDTLPDRVNLCADTGHLYFAGINPIEFFKKNMNRIKHIHFKDVRHDVFKDIKSETDSFLKSVLKGAFTVPGDGCIDFSEISKIIIKSNYTGWVIIEAEQDPEIANPLEYAIRSRNYLNTIWNN